MRLSRSAGLDTHRHPIQHWDVPGGWPELARALCSGHYPTADKAGAPLWSPCEVSDTFRPLRLHCAVLDLDLEAPGGAAIRTEQVLAVVERLRARGIAAVVHSTWSAASAGPGRTKARVVVPLAEPVPAAAWRGVWRAIRDDLAPEADRMCKDAGRRYFAPSAPPEAPQAAVWALELPGAPLTPPKPATAALDAPEPIRKVLREELTLLARAWSRHVSTVRHAVALRAVLAGDPYAEPGDREATTWDLCRALAKAIPDADSKHLASHFGASLALMGNDAPTLDSVADKIDRARAHAAEQVQSADAPPTEPRILVTPLASLYFVKGNGWEGPFGGDAIDLAITRALQDDPEIALEAVTPQGMKPKPRSTLLREYGERVSKYGIKLGAPAHTYDPENRSFTEAAAAPRDLVPMTAIDYEIAYEFVSAIAGGNEKTFRDLHTWLARLPDLEDTLAALVLLGPPGLGKGLFASACSRLWTTDGPLDADDAFGTWNDGLLRCPLIFADEKMPTAWGGRDMSAEIRKVLAARTTPIRRRFTPQVNARGCVRMVVAANNDSIMSFASANTEDDIRAISERFYVIHLDEARCRSFLHRFPGAHERLVSGDALARYARALPQPDAATRVGRFWIAGPVHDAEKIAIRAGSVFNLLSWTVAWLQAPQTLHALNPGHLSHVSGAGEVLVSLAEVGASWARYYPGENPPERTKLAHAARAVGVQTRTAKGRLWSIKLSYLDAWIRDSGWSCPSVQELIAARQARPNLAVVK